MRISDWSSDVCSSDLLSGGVRCDRGRSQPAPDRRRTGRPRRRHDAAQPSAGPILRRKLARADRGGAHRQRPARSAPRRTDDPVGGRPVPRARLQAGPAHFVGEPHRRAPLLRPARLRPEPCRHETASEGLTMAGKFFDEWQIGDSIAHDIRRTVTETDNLLFTTMTHNPQPLHLDIEAAKASEFGQILVNGTFTFSLMVGLSVGDTTLGTLVANLGYDKLVMPKPVFLGDTLRATSEIIGLKESRSRPNAGIVTFLHRCINQREEIVCQCERSALIKKKDA